MREESLLSWSPTILGEALGAIFRVPLECLPGPRSASEEDVGNMILLFEFIQHKLGELGSKVGGLPDEICSRNGATGFRFTATAKMFTQKRSNPSRKSLSLEMDPTAPFLHAGPRAFVAVLGELRPRKNPQSGSVDP